MTKDQNIKIPELQSLDDRIAMLEKKKKDSIALKATDVKPTALAQAKKKTAVKKPKKDLINKAFEEEEIYAQIPNANLIQVKFIEDFDEQS
jgi:hypothetical protein